MTDTFPGDDGLGRRPLAGASGSHARRPDLTDCERERTRFSWASVRRELTGDGRADLNMARVAVDRHAEADPAKAALRFVGRDFAVTEVTYGALRDRTDRFAGLLRDLGVGPGEVVASLLGRVPALYTSALGAMKNRDLFCPLFTAFGPGPLRQRLSLARIRVLVTTASLYRSKIEPMRGGLPDLRHVLLAGETPGAGLPVGCLPLEPLLEAAGGGFETPSTADEDPALLHFTSGTTGMPKAAVHAHAAILTQYASSRLVLDLDPDDRFWCTADPGWVTGSVYGIIGPLSVGATLVADPEPFDPQRWYRILESARVSVWYTAPTAIRMLMRAGDELPGRFDLSALRHAASVGEPLNPEAVLWGQKVLGLPFHDTWWQTETGGIMIANCPDMDIRPGSMGRPLPGIEAAVVRRIGGRAEPVTEPDVEGELALRAGWPSMFRSYLGEPERYARCFADGWYLSGDLARRDADGYFWFVGRGDDLIKTSGHLIGPFEVESVLMEHEGVAEAGVIGRPDPIAGQIVKAFVALKPGYTGDEALRRSLLAHARRRLGAAVAPKDIAFRERLPKTRSGKILRRLLKAEEAGEAAGDLSTLDDD
jgi:acetyl-CoA synthetase